MNAYENIKSNKKKYQDNLNKINNIVKSGNTTYSILLATKENKIQTKPDDKAYSYEVEAFHLRRINEISLYVLEKKMNHFKQTFYSRYSSDITKLRKNTIAKNVKYSQIWEKMKNLIEI